MPRRLRFEAADAASEPAGRICRPGLCVARVATPERSEVDYGGPVPAAYLFVGSFGTLMVFTPRAARTRNAKVKL